MANRIDGTANGCTFQWKIENISHCWLKAGENIDSPKFITYALQDTKWFLRLYPKLEHITIYLYRELDCVGPDSVTVHFEIALLDKDGTHLQERIRSNCRYLKGNSTGLYEFEKREKVFVTHRETFLHKDTLTIQCTIWNTEQKPVKSEHVYARTTFSLDRRNFTSRIEEFSSLKCDEKHTFKDSFIEFDIGLIEGPIFGKKLVININLFDKSINYLSLKASIVDSEGEKENCCSQKIFEGDLKKGALCTLLRVNKLMENRRRYLPNDVLTLDFEYVYSNGTISYGSGNITPKLTNEMQKVESISEYHPENQKSETLTAIAKDLISMYNDRIFCDIEIRTSTQTFPAHKNILSARSSVFRRILSNEMKEKISGHIDIDDLEDDIVHQMLLYMYTDTLDDLQYENAYKLYMAADKYEIVSLRDSCSSFMKNNLCPDKACDVLALADLHQDDDLKNDVHDFILKHDKEVFGSREWKEFIHSNSKLAADMMYLFTLSKI